ncbi:hypothetical protein [Williamsia serinedens]|uniref:Transmembrane protein n=1 Tax=Williamsia serinedens TaxID=391736 RepID=A0ABT1H407_9NOCA|nr:hypothetical protein [Williamsia serinedens]MCP2161881.1 hypothetical protein [Williamsia serinedens]
MHEFEAILKVLAVGLVLGAGLPALFAVGLRLVAAGSGDNAADGTTTAPNAALRYAGIALFVLVGAVIVLGILWITRTTINYHFGVNLFPFAPVK